MPFVNVPLGINTRRRDYGAFVDLPLVNMFLEQDAGPTEDPVALLRRPGTDFFRAFGTGPIRAIFTQPGLFGSDLFVVSGRQLFRFDGTTETPIVGLLSDRDTPVSITYQVIPGSTQRLWLADGETLFYYEGEGRARGDLTATGQVSDGDVVEMGGVYYQFVASSVDSGSPAGTVGNPWRVLIGSDIEESLANLGDAVIGGGLPGGTYSTALVPNPLIETRRVLPSSLSVQAIVPGAAGNALTTTETSAVLSWGNPTLENGGDHVIVPVGVPESDADQSPVSVTTLAAYVIISVAESDRLFLIRPGEFWVEQFVTAETEPDEVLEVLTLGDAFWALGQSTIEPWFATGDFDIPFAPQAGAVRRFGYVAGTAAIIDNELFFVDERGIVRNSSGERLSTHAIEEAIRKGVLE